MLQSVGEILRADNAVLKRGGFTPNKAETIENTGGSNHPRSTLLHRHRLRQVARLVYVTAAHDGDVVREQLEWNGG